MQIKSTGLEEGRNYRVNDLRNVREYYAYLLPYILKQIHFFRGLDTIFKENINYQVAFKKKQQI